MSEIPLHDASASALGGVLESVVEAVGGIRSLDFVSGWFLILLGVVPVVYFVSRRSLAGLGRGRETAAVVMRSAALALTVLALARMRLLKENDRLCVIFVVDRSDSVPAERRQSALRYIDDLIRTQGGSSEDFVGIVVFGKDAGFEQSPARIGFEESEPEEADLEEVMPRDISTLIDSDATNIQAAIQLAVTAFPEGVGGRRLVLFTDGNENLGEALDEVRSARSLGIVVDVVPLSYSYPAEISLEKLVLSPEVNIGQPFSVQAVIQSTREAEVKLRLFENGALVPQPDAVHRLKPGKNSFEFQLRRDEPGLYSYEVQIEVLRDEEDAIVQNNLAHGFTMIQGEPRVLFCAPDPENEGALLAALEAERIHVEVRKPEFLPRDMEDYFDYGAVILSNVGAHSLSQERMLLFENLVKGLGLGFVMIGGEESFGAGGYQGTPVERLLPVDMEVKQKQVLPNGALAFVVHSCELGNGNEWARRVIQQAIRILSPRDYAGVLYYGGRGGENWLFRMRLCTPGSKQMMFRRLRNFNPGDMVSFQPIMKMAYDGLKGISASIKHMVVLSDGDPGMPNQTLLDRITKEQRITISTVCYGSHGGVIPPSMKEMARQGNGSYHYLRRGDANKLPEIFIREATKVRKSLISQEPFMPLPRSWGQIVQGLEADEFPQLDGYVLTSPKALADLLLVHPGSAEDPTQDPVLAAWSFGLGRSVAFTSDAGRRWGERWTRWAGYQRFWGQLVRWVAKARQSELFRVSRQVEGGRARIVIDAISESGDFLNGLQIKGSVVTPGPRYESREVQPRQVGPGRYELSFPVDAKGSYGLSLSTEVGGAAASYVTGVSVPYSPEYRKIEANHGLLRQLADAGGGRLVSREMDADFFSRDFEATRTVMEVWKPLLIISIFLFFADIFVRRVMIDYRAVYARAALALKSLREGGKSRETREADARLATLLRAKAEVRKRTAVAAPRSRPADAEDDAEGVPTSFDERFDAGRVATSREGKERKAAAAGKAEGAPGAAATSEEDASESYTGRLLDAKRRALRDREEED